MPAVGIRELKTHASKLVRRVREEGAIIDITYYGEVVARLVPAKQVKTSTQELAALWDEMDRLSAVVSAEWTGSSSAVDTVREDRREL
jgi:prevent-host-death family protein